MLSDQLENAMPTVYDKNPRRWKPTESDFDPDTVDPINVQEIFDYL
ncbi:unnamed protein product, partial [Gongylonema pulchrum]